MNIIIVGAGNVGSTIAGVLSSAHNVLMIESDSRKSEIAKSSMNVSVLQENGVNPRVIEEAIARHSADVLIAATPNDENNLFACIVAKDSKKEIRTIAKIRNPDFMRAKENDTYFGADQIMSPELASAKKLAKLAMLENAVDYDDIEGLGLAAAIFSVTEIHKKMVKQAVMGIDVPDDCAIVAVYRDNDVILYKETTEIHIGDLLCVLGTPNAILEFNKMMGYIREAKEIIIVGGGIIGTNVAKILEAGKKYLKLIEQDPERCKRLAREMDNVLIVNANGVDPNLLKSENAGRADVTICATESDEKNLLASLVARDLGALKVVSRYSKREYEDVFSVTGIKSIVGYHRLIANEMTKTLISDEKAIMKMSHEMETLFSVAVNRNSRVKGSLLGDLQFPEGSRAVCVIRNGTPIFPRLDTRLEENDVVLLYTYETKMNKIEKMFGIRMTDV
ncbi:MAG: Trk system potassium transporter TrkA [Methanomassiliicoccaceae archaeon]|nr:Trk system potassium transporter TrkA [Methanomassiliicoccaceae archaeon]